MMAHLDELKHPCPKNLQSWRQAFLVAEIIIRLEIVGKKERVTSVGVTPPNGRGEDDMIGKIDFVIILMMVSISAA